MRQIVAAAIDGHVRFAFGNRCARLSGHDTHGCGARAYQIRSTWFGYRELRNVTSHVYDPAKAKKVFGALNRFLLDAKDLHARLDRAAK